MRDCLAGQSARGRLPRTDLAGAVVARARRTHRRRQLVGLVAVVGATVLATGVLLQDWQGSGGTTLGPAAGRIGDPVATAAPTPDRPAELAHDPALPFALAADLVGDGVTGGRVLATGDGRTMDLGAVDTVVSAHRVAEGWAVVGGDPGTTRLWWLGADGASVTVLAGMDSIVVERERVAWRRGAVLATARLSGQGDLVERFTTAAPEGGGLPVGFLGERVLLSRTDPAGWDTWLPTADDYRPAWNDQVTRVYGALPGGQEALGLVPPQSGGEPAGACLARLAVDRELAPAEVACLPGELSGGGGLSVDGPAALSPDGRWLVTTTGDPEAGPVLVDVAAAFAQQPAVTTVPEVSAVTGKPVWLDPERAVLPTADGLVRLAPERLLAGSPGGVEVTPLAGAAVLVVEPG
ncbi:MAG: hypothetical protein GEV12_12435 [Micromonosporaceae bacterium]|nr:hypothetical protein [Micromonosporaceae bacterium]